MNFESKNYIVVREIMNKFSAKNWKKDRKDHSANLENNYKKLKCKLNPFLRGNML